MKRSLTKREGILLLLLLLLAIGMGYYKLFLEPLQQQIERFQNGAFTIESESDAELARAAKLRQMQQRIEQAEASGMETTIPAYDNSDYIKRYLHTALADTASYELQFGAIRDIDYIVERPVSIQFTADSYRLARKTIDTIHDSKYLCLVTDLDVSMDRSSADGSVSVFLQILFYEAR